MVGIRAWELCLGKDIPGLCLAATMHDHALYDFLYSQVFMEPTIPNTMWVILVGEEMLLVGGVVEIGHFCFIVDRRSDCWYWEG
jgi:hypothetical protein